MAQKHITAVPEPMRIRPPTRLLPAEAVIARHAFVIEYGATKEDLLRPELWVHVARWLTPGARVEVMTEDLSWIAEVIVRDVGQNSATVALISYTQLSAGDFIHAVGQSEALTVEWKGIGRKYSVIRESDKAVLRHGFNTRDAADQWVKNHHKAAMR